MLGPEMGLMDIHVTIQVAQGLQQKGTWSDRRMSKVPTSQGDESWKH